MKRIWAKPELIEALVSKDHEHIELFKANDDRSTPLCLLAPEVPVLADKGRVKIEWLIGNSTNEEKRLRKIVMTGLDVRLLKKDDPMPWTTLVYQCYDSENLCELSGTTIGWAIEHSVPTAPARPEWMFDDVSDVELIACCLWEYGRESHTLRLSSEKHWIAMRSTWWKDDYAKDEKLKEWHDQKQKWIEESLMEAGDTYSDFLERFWNTDQGYIEIYDDLKKHGGSSAPAWQELTQVERERLVGNVGESNILRPVVPASVAELEKLWQANSAELVDIRSRNLPKNDDTEDGALFEDSQAIEILPENEGEPVERISAALTFDFSRFTDREMLDALRDWLKNTRPRNWKRPRRVFPNAPQRGRKLGEYRVALERLGLMRLLNDNYPDELRKNYPEVWRRLCRDDTHFRRECKLACEFYRNLFPFLPEDDLPRSSKPIDVWEPEIEEELARQHASEEPPTGNKS